MASYHGSSSNNNTSEPAKMEQIITEFFAKTLHIILESRCPYMSSRQYSGDQLLLLSPSPSSSSSSSSSVRPRDKWFNLALRDCPAALDNIDFWRHSNLEPMVIDVCLVRRPVEWDQSDNSQLTRSCHKVIERWFVQYESRKSGSKRHTSMSSHVLYKKSILLLRTIYVTLRLLPAYKIFRDLNSSGHIRAFDLTHRVSSFVEPFSRREESEMQRFIFTPVDTSCGRLSISVLYRTSVSSSCLEPSAPVSPHFISDYVGSPMASPLKRLPSLNMPQESPSSSPYGRRHSWSYDLSRASPSSAFPSPSPTHSDSRASFYKMASNRLPPTSLPRHLSEVPQVLSKDSGFDDYSPSLIFTPSPSASPPTYGPGNHISNVLLRSDSAPVNIPSTRFGDTSLSSPKKILPPSPSPSPSSKTTSNNILYTDRRSSLLPAGSTIDKLFTGKDESGKLPCVKLPSNVSPQKSVSRSSSKFSFEDIFDDNEFSGPFVVDDDEIADLCSRPGSFDRNVCALVHMLRKAPPLRQDTESKTTPQGMGPGTSSNHTQLFMEAGLFKQASSLSVAASNLAASRTTTDALEELRGYRDMKDLLLGQKKS